MTEEEKRTVRNFLLKGCLGIFVVVFLIPVLLSIKTINPGTVVVATKFGGLNGIRREGTYLALFEGYTVYDIKTKQVNAHHEAGSKNGQYIYVDTAFAYNLKADKLESLFSEVGTQEDLENKFINPVIKDVVYQSASQYTADEILPKRAEFRDLVIKTIRERMNQEYFDFIDLQIIDIDFTKEYNASLENKQIAEQNAIKDRQVAEQNSEKLKIEIEQNLRQKTYELEASKIDAQKQGLLQQTLTQELLRKQWIEKWNGVLPTTLTGDDTSILLSK